MILFNFVGNKLENSAYYIYLIKYKHNPDN